MSVMGIIAMGTNIGATRAMEFPTNRITAMEAIVADIRKEAIPARGALLTATSIGTNHIAVTTLVRDDCPEAVGNP